LSRKSQSIHHSWTKSFDHDVCAFDEPLCDLQVGLDFQIEFNAALASLQDGIGLILPASAARWVDPNDVCALIGEEHRSHGAGQVLAEVDNSYSFKRSWHDSTLNLKVFGIEV
jgi:hypothetical protein